MTRAFNIFPGLLFLLLFAGHSEAVQYTTNKKFVEENLPKGCKLSKVTLQLRPEEKEKLAKKWGWEGVVTEVSFIVGKDAEGKALGVVYFTTLYATEHKCVHELAVALSPEGAVKDVAVVQVFCERAMPVATQSFLGQFRKKAPKTLKLNEDINAVTSATESSKTVLEAVNTAIAGYVEFVKK